ncbi:HAMP domain-containing protein, partial [Proteus terrae]|uniref:HAMP domain-containing protein n=1 Tax=Proteus terrae TaxID=1574161 RepID=UPI003314E025
AHQRYSRDIDVAFHYISVKIDEIIALNQKLKSYPSTIAHRQVVQEIIAMKILIDRRLIARLNKLSDDLAHVAKGNLTEPVLIEGQDEIGL